MGIVVQLEEHVTDLMRSGKRGMVILTSTHLELVTVLKEEGNMKLCVLFLLTFCCLLGEIRAEQQAIEAFWVLKSPPTAKRDAEIDKGSANVPLLTNDGCKKNYKIEKVLWSLDATNEERIRQGFLGSGSTSDLEVTIVKLFDGRAELPILIIYDNAGKSHRLTFDRSVDFNKWSSKGYQIKAKFSADSIQLPKFWKKIELICDSPNYPKVGDRKSENSIVRNTPPEQGRELHIKLLKRHAKIDQFYQKPMLYAELTNDPLVVINLPIEDWDSISGNDRNLLCEYVASLVNQVRSNPFSYTRIPPDAPIAPKLRANISKMTDKSWGILAGRISEDGRDIYSDKLVKTGKE